jgi:hypothetical protein
VVLPGEGELERLPHGTPACPSLLASPFLNVYLYSSNIQNILSPLPKKQSP